MKVLDKLLDRQWKISLILLLAGFAIYFSYYHSVLLNANAILSGITGDALKNYFTYAYHITNDKVLLDFSGMNFPYGEHIVYTDCQPLLTFILKLLPFTHNYLIGILHWLLFISFMVTPVIVYKVLSRLNVDKFSSISISIAITLLSPQFGKIFGGHHGLAYGCFIPLSILFILEFVQKKQTKTLIKISIYNFLLFFIHPYMGFSVTVFTFLSLLFYFLLNTRKDKLMGNVMSTLIAGLLPILIFKLFMALSDGHSDRTTEPQGLNVLVENFASLLAPDFGPFQQVMESVFTNKIAHLEGHSYLGIFVILLSVSFLLALLFLFKKYFFRNELLALLFASLLLLMLSFGWHYKVLELAHIKISALDQFRAVCRFAWVFYYVLPVFLFSVIYHSIEPYLERKMFRTAFRGLCILYLVLNFVEADSYLKKDQDDFWKFRNVLNEKYLNSEEKAIVKDLLVRRPQAILALPLFHIGSETYARLGGDNSMIPAMIYSYHASIPIFGVSLSRTSISETENEINLLNSYQKNRAAFSMLNGAPFFIIRTTDALLPDEERLLTNFENKWKNDSLQMGYLSQSELLSSKSSGNNLTIDISKTLNIDSNSVLFISKENKKPFISSASKEYETICVLDSNKIRTGKYVVSFHLHNQEGKGKKEFPAFIITRRKGDDYKWLYYQSTRLISGFYNKYAVFEYPIDLEKDCQYEFVLKGDSDQAYSISDFLLRPGELNVIGLNGNDTIFNNFGK